jgi:hypothetical protein
MNGPYPEITNISFLAKLFFKTFISLKHLSDYLTVGLSDRRTIGLSDYSYGPDLSERFVVRRGVRQSDPLSPYLLIIAVEILSAALKFNPKIKGISNNNSEFHISQYADDSTLSLYTTLYIFIVFETNK